MAGGLLDGGEVDTEELGTALQGRSDGPGEGGVVGFPSVHAR
jgi:hypothetical protein